jgi:hypothetical protein
VPRFFFHLYDDVVSLDGEGNELPDMGAAREKAISRAPAIACQEVLEGHLNLGHRIEGEDERGAPVLTAHFSDVVKLEA